VVISKVSKQVGFVVLTGVLVFYGLTMSWASTKSRKDDLSQAAETYVRLGLELGHYDKDYVDAYLGPKEWQEAAKSPRSKAKLAADIAELLNRLDTMSVKDSKQALRRRSLYLNVRAMDTRARMVNGEKFSFAEEARLIYDVELPEFDFNEYDQALIKIDQLLPGENDLADRVDTFYSKFDVPAKHLSKLIDASIDECRKRTKAFITMPDSESFTLDYVTDKSWSGYNWYQGNSISLMQINQDFPTKISRGIELGCHEAYPGHHLWNVLIEEELIKNKGWIEFNLYPLFSPYGVIAEGSAEYGIGLAFPGDEKLQFEKEVLYPLVGLSTKETELYERVGELTKELKYARIAIAQQYLDGNITRKDAVKLTVKYSLLSEKRAESSVKFIEQYRAYVLNYSMGEHLIAAYIKRNSNTRAERWALFKTLLTQLSTASDLIE